jgi:endoglucanase
VSEGQAYTLLRAVWMNDQPTFDRVWAWTRDHLARTGRDAPSLMAWHWTRLNGGGVTDWNHASDADTDLALALIMAGDRWRAPTTPDTAPYHDTARAVLVDLLDQAVIADGEGHRLILPGTWADERNAGRGVILNPSYLAPAAYRLFARVTRDARWTDVATGSYIVLESVCRDGSSARPIPDWIRWTSRAQWSPEGRDGPPRSGWDAIRVPWRIATDLIWFDAPEARQLLATCLAPFVQAQQARSAGMAAEYALNGGAVSDRDHPLANAMYSFALSSKRDRDRLLQRVRGRLVEGPGGLFFADADRYYVNSLAYLPFLVRAGGYAPPASAGGR